jgi:hypothetical protein
MRGRIWGNTTNPARASEIALTGYDIVLCTLPIAAFLSIVAFV